MSEREMTRMRRVLLVVTERKLNLFDCIAIGIAQGLLHWTGHWWPIFLIVPGAIISCALEEMADAE